MWLNTKLSALTIALLCALGSVSGCRTAPVDPSVVGLPQGVAAIDADQLLIVDCLLPGTVRKLGSSQTFMTPRRPVRATAHDCELRGGEYVAYDRADYSTSLRVWLAQAESGDRIAETYVGEIYERGLGTEPDYAMAAMWYRRAAEKGYGPAQINLGSLYERGLGVEASRTLAYEWYQRASGLSELGVAYMSAGVVPDDRWRVGPSIHMIDPPVPLTRGSAESLSGPPRPGSTIARDRAIVGRVEAPGGLIALVVNEIEVDVDEDGVFRAPIPLGGQENEVVVTALDVTGKSNERRFHVRQDGSWRTPSASEGTPLVASAEEAGLGRFYALVIGNQAYRGMPPLTTAIRDAEAVGELLETQYGFDVTLLRDATRYDILSTLNQLRAELDENDSLLIYYAGHGDLDQTNMRGHWLPVDAERNSSANWLSNVAVTDVLNTMNARHVLVVSDSCYSGALTRSAMASFDEGMSEKSREAWVKAMASGRSRIALTSGGLAPVLDEGDGEHSVFANAFLEVLAQNRSLLEGQRLYQEIAARVTLDASAVDFEQAPQYAPIQHSGHESGDFFFMPTS